MAKKRERNYTMGDDEMLERAQVFHDHLAGELPNFTARFPWLDPAWLAAYQADIAAADAFPKDESVILDLKILTGDVTASMQQGYAALQTLGGYAKLAYPTDAARERVFGQQYWADAKDNTLKLQEALELAHAKADSASFKPDLLAKGYTQAEIDQLLTLADDLQTKNGLQEALKVGRHVTKADRIALLNVVWDHMRTINTCASVVWAADADRFDQYKLYPSSGSGGTDNDDPTAEGNISGTVTNPMANPIEGALVSMEGMGIDTQTDSNGNYAFGNLGSGSYTLNFSATGYAPAVVPGVQVTAGQTTDLDVTLNPDMAVNTTISGTVMSMSTMMPIANAQVSLIVGGNASSTQTNSMGEYVLGLGTLVAPVNGTLQVSALGHATESRSITVVPGSTLVESFNLMAAP